MTVFTFIRFIIGVALVFLPFTQLRFSFIGVGETLLMISMALFLIAGRFKINRSTLDFLSLYFWAPFIFLSLVGLFYNVTFLNYSSGSFGSALFDLFSYIFIAFMILILGDNRIYGEIGPINFYFNVFFSIVLILLISFILSFYASSVFGLQLKYEIYFAPMVENVHQMAMLLCVLPFIGAAFLKTDRTKMEKLFILSSFPFLVAMALSSGSTKAALGILVGLSVVFLALLVTMLSRKNTVVSLSIYGAVFLTVLFIIFAQGQLSVLISLFTEYDGHGARAKLYTIGLNKFYDNPIFGHGPGSHISYFGAESAFSDAHNTILTIAIQAGIFGVLLLLIMLMRLFYQNLHEPWLLGAISAFAIYLAGGDILRRAPMWIMLIIIMFLSEHKKHALQKNTAPII